MCRTGGPYCYERKMGREARTALNEKRVKNLTERLNNIPKGAVTPDLDAARNRLLEAKKNLAETAGEGIETDKSRLTDNATDLHTPDGGFSVNVKHPGGYVTAPTRGFLYSPYPERSMVVSNAKSVTLKQLMHFVEDNKDLLDKDEHYFGAWHDPKTGKLYLDVSCRTEDAKIARQECEKHDQIAFFDLQVFESATVDPEAKSGQK